MYWRSKNQLDENLEFKKFSETEFPPEANPQKEVSVNRRDFFKYMGATVVLGGLTSCIRLPKQKIFPYNKSPENIVPGKATYFATTMAIGEELTPLLVESHEGRPTKVEGNPNVDLSQGSTHSLHQASVLSLYDPDRLKKFKINDLQHSSFDKSISFLTESLKKDLKNTAIITGYLPSKVLNQQLKDLQKQGVDVFRADSYNKDNLREGIRLATGKVLDVDYRFDKADVVISFEADFLSNLMTDSVRNTKDFSSRRGADNKSKMNRLYCFEGNHSLVGSTADHRFSVNSDEIKYVLAKISLEISKNSLAGKNFPGSEVIKQLNSMANHKFTSEIEKAISVIVDDLLSKRQKSILLAGYHQDPVVHGLIYILNYALGNSGKTVFYYSVPNLLKVPNKIQKDRFYKNLFKNKYKNVIFVNHDYLHFLPDSKK